MSTTPAPTEREGGPGQPRAAKPYDERPYVWCSRKAIEEIQRAAGIGHDVAFSVATYFALCRIASEGGNSAKVRVQTKVVAGMLGLRYRKTQALLKFLEDDAKVIRSADAGGHQGGNIDELLSFRTHAPRCRGDGEEPRHGGASHPGTDLKRIRADRQYKKKKPVRGSRPKAGQARARVSSSMKKGQVSKPPSRLGAGVVLNQPSQRIPEPTAPRPPAWTDRLPLRLRGMVLACGIPEADAAAVDSLEVAGNTRHAVVKFRPGASTEIQNRVRAAVVAAQARPVEPFAAGYTFNFVEPTDTTPEP
jgi:hypothetical protein